MRVRTSSKRAQIVGIASEVFREQGFEGASMSEIAGRLGGSKATLYGYFASKEELFLAVTEASAEAHFGAIWRELDATQDIAPVLEDLGTKFLTFVLQPNIIAAERMVLAVSGQTGIGRAFYERGPKNGLQRVAALLEKAIKSRQLREADPWLMAQQLMALFEAELRLQFMYGVTSELPPPERIEKVVQNAVGVFLAAYAFIPP